MLTPRHVQCILRTLRALSGLRPEHAGTGAHRGYSMVAGGAADAEASGSVTPLHPCRLHHPVNQRQRGAHCLHMPSDSGIGPGQDRA